MMSKPIAILLSIIILTFIDFKIWSNVLNERVNFTRKRVYILILFMIISSMLINLFVTSSLKLAITFLISIITCSFVYENKLQHKIMAVFATQVLLIASELIFVLLSYNVLHLDLEKIANMYTGTLIMNIFVACLELLLFKCSCCFSIEKKLINFTDRINVKYMILLLFSVMFFANIFIYTTYYKISSIMFLVLNSFTIGVYMLITYKFLEEQNKNLLIKVEYDSLLDKSVEYETMIDKNRRDTHENKNDLIVLDSLISPRNKEAKKQIKSMIQDYERLEKELKGDKNLYRKTLPIPSGGLRGLIYHKLLLIEDLNINYDLRIGRNVNSKNFKNVNPESIRQFVKIAGVYLDNAIDAVKNLEDREINIELYVEEGYFCLLIANNFEGSLDIEKLGTMGYTSKGKSHGYGLSLAKEILSNNNELVNETSIYMDIMTQIIKIKM